MQNWLLMPLVLTSALHSCAYEYNKPQASFQKEEAAYKTQTSNIVQPGTTIIKGSNGRDYEVTMSASRKIFETRLPPSEETFLVQQIDHPATAAANQQIQQLQFYNPQDPNSLPTTADNNNYQQFYNNQQQQQQQNFNLNSNQHKSVPTVNDAQHQHHNQFSVHSNHQHLQQQQRQLARAQQQTGLLSRRVQHQPTGYFYPNPQQQQEQQFSTFPQTFQQEYGTLAQQQSQQQQYYPQQYEQYLQQPLRSSNNLPDSNNLLNDLLNNQKYVSQSQASQLDVYAYKQINANLRPFTRTITKCDVLGQCEAQNADADAESSLATDFHHQQVLKQSKALVEPAADKCQNKFNYQFTGNALTNNQVKAQRGIPIKVGTELKDRRLIPYNETALTQYAQN